MTGSFMHYSINSEKSFNFMTEAVEGALFHSQRLQKESPEDAIPKYRKWLGKQLQRERCIKVESRKSLTLLRAVC